MVNEYAAYVHFAEMPQGTVFLRNGTLFKKQSSRTARPVDYPAAQSFYFGKYELCQVGHYSRLDATYFNK